MKCQSPMHVTLRYATAPPTLEREKSVISSLRRSQWTHEFLSIKSMHRVYFITRGYS
jgi:hypothetical protein